MSKLLHWVCVVCGFLNFGFTLLFISIFEWKSAMFQAMMMVLCFFGAATTKLFNDHS